MSVLFVVVIGRLFGFICGFVVNVGCLFVYFICFDDNSIVIIIIICGYEDECY